MILDGKKIKQETETALTIVKPLPKIREAFYLIIDPILNSSLSVEGYYSQILKHQGGSGLAFEMLIFDSKIYYDIVISSDDLKYNNTYVDNITQMLLDMTPIKDAGENLVRDHSIFFEVYFGEQMSMNYKASINRLKDILEVKRKINELKRT